jgi:peptidoglycan/LPS O-acetylase OafA/YrhL
MLWTVALWALLYPLLFAVYRARGFLLPAPSSGMPVDAAIMWLGYISPYARVFEFVAGCLAARCYMAWRETPPTGGERRLAIGTAALAGLLIAARLVVLSDSSWFASPRSYLDFISYNYSFAPLVAWLLFFVCRYPTALSVVLSSRPAVKGGDISYSLYMFHPLVILMFNHPGRPPLGVTSLLDWILRVSLALAVILIVSWGSFGLVEEPARRYLRRRLAPAASTVQPASRRADRTIAADVASRRADGAARGAVPSGEPLA